MRVRSCAEVPASALPSKCTEPASLRNVPHMQFTSVLLPEPLGPISPTRSPSRTESSIDSRATKPPKRLPRPLTSSNGSPVMAGIQQARFHTEFHRVHTEFQG